VPERVFAANKMTRTNILQDGAQRHLSEYNSPQESDNR